MQIVQSHFAQVGQR